MVTSLEKIADIPKFKRATALEGLEQEALFEMAGWSRGQYPELDDLFSVPNFTKGTNKFAVHDNIKMGLKRGIPDMLLPHGRCGFNSLYIELKRKGGSLTVDQKRVIPRLNKAGNLAVIAWSADEAWWLIINYLEENTELLKQWVMDNYSLASPPVFR